MKVKTCKNLPLPLGTVLTVALLLGAIPAQCDDDLLLLGRANNFTQGSDISSSPPGLHRIKPLLAPGQEDPFAAAVPTQQRKSPNAVASSFSLSMEGEEEKSSGNHHPDNSHYPLLEADDDAEKKLNPNLGESRSNSSSASKQGGLIPSKHPLFADHHNANAPSHAAAAVSADNHDLTVAQESTAHEHIIRYQQHQGSDESDEDNFPGNANLNHQQPHRPKTSSEEEDDTTHPKLVADSVVVSSDSFPVRVGPNVRVKGNPNPGFSSNNNRTGGGNNGIRKPIPVIRHEESAHSQEHN